MKNFLVSIVVSCCIVTMSHSMDSCNNNETGDNAPSDLSKASINQRVDEAFINNCKEIVLYQNVIESKLPEDASLQSLHLSKQRITSASAADVVAVLAEVMRLKVTKDAKPDAVKRVEIKYVSLSGNLLIDLPPQFFGFASTMRGLDLSSNSLVECPNLQSFSNLTNLVLENNEITKLQISGLPKLWRLVASRNQIQELNLENLPALEKLNVSNNRLKNLPDSLKALTSLKDLNGSFNNFSEIPSVLGEMKHLQAVDMVQVNGFKGPIDIKELSHLKKLTVSSKDSISKSVWGRFVELFTNDISNYDKTAIAAKSYFLNN